jgi:hypothetical protein
MLTAFTKLASMGKISASLTSVHPAQLTKNWGLNCDKSEKTAPSFFMSNSFLPNAVTS